ncbi:hypothetical protein ACKWTF_002035 [Chironomus riparius]
MFIYGEDCVWVKPILTKNNGEYDVPFAAKIQSTDKDRLLVTDDDGKEFWITKNQILKAMHSTSNDTVADMIALFELEEHTILRNLCMRYMKKEIYTYIGSMLVAINPYEILPIYTNNEINHYKNQNVHMHSTPHIFAIGNNAYKEMRTKNRNQCIVISGESGAGKTESTKLILQYLAAVSGKHSWIEQQVLDSNPIMEAFGNARTIRNDNSSRFGKYIDIFFNDSGAIEGAKIEHYLLEKSRIVSASKGERNYHIFYAMLAGLTKEERKRLELEDATKYNYLTCGGIIKCENRNDANEFTAIKSAMSVLSFSDEEFWEIIKLLSAILHMGNLKYKATTVQNLDACEIADSLNIARIARVLEVPQQLLNNALLQKTIFAHGERVTSSLTKEQAIEARDAFVKAIYGKCFVMIVEKINQTIYKTIKKKCSIGVLDIFGFENFGSNSFEQLCINYANENLQQFFVKYIFKLEQEEYTNEGIDWQNIEFIDNQEILDMIGLKPMNIMALINEETIFPKGSESTLVAKLHTTHGTKTIYVKPKYEDSSEFGIQHYAGNVFYNSNGFLEKNRDSFNYDLKELIMKTSNKFLLSLFSADDALDTSKKSITLSLQFRNSLEALMKTLLACDPSFVRCIKPNELQRPNILDKPLCVRQLRYSGMMETAKIRKAGFAIRHTYKDFVTRYRFLVKGITTKSDFRSAANKICTQILSSMPNYAFGKTKIFLKEQHDMLLETMRNDIYMSAIAVIQRGFRRLIFKKFMQRYRNAATVIQKNWRARAPRQRFLTMQRGFKRLQAAIHSKADANRYDNLRNSYICLQARCRGFLTRRNLLSKISEKSQRMAELGRLRVQEEQELKKANHPRWKQEAEMRFLTRLSTLNKELKIETERKSNQQYQMSIEEEDKLVDDVFSFLTELPTPVAKPRTTYTPSYKSFGTSTDDLKSNQHNNEVVSMQKGEKFQKEDLSAYTFQKFAATYFLTNVSYQFSKRTIKTSLLDLPMMMQVSAQALWITILRFMGDLGEAKYEDIEKETFSRQNVMQKITSTLGRRSQLTKEFQGILQTKHPERKLLYATLKNKNKLSREFMQLVHNSEDLQQYQEWINMRSSHLDKLHFIVGHGILREELRDEIYCQICKQLTNNPTSISFKKGWILMALCIGCFPPSLNFEPYLRQFIRTGPELYAPYCENKLDRTFQNGVRKQPPSWHEMHSSKSTEPIVVTVNLMDETSINVEIDSSSTSNEVCIAVAKAIHLKDLLGFSLFVTIEKKVMSLGCEHQFVFDAVSRCEQYAKEHGITEKNVKWQLYLQKEMFTPWYNPMTDPVSTNLIYHQLVKGFHSGDYACTTEKDIAMILALRYYAEIGSKYEKEKMMSKIADFLPISIYRKETASKWEVVAANSFIRSRCVRDNLPAIAAKEDIVFFAKITWVLKFSRFFEVLKIEDEASDTGDNVFILAINCTGVYLIDSQEQVLLELSFPEISNVTYKENEETNANATFTLITIASEILKFKSHDSFIIFKWINFLLNHLKKKSTYAVAIRSFVKELTDENVEDYLELKRGDLVMLEQTGETISNSTSMWTTGKVKDKKGYFPIDSIMILPCIEPPNKEVIALYARDGHKKVAEPRSKYNTLQRQKMHTLKFFAEQHFRPNIEITNMYGTLNTFRRQYREIWCNSREPIKSPLLMKLQGEGDRSNLAVQMFISIMKYMGDLPQSKNSISHAEQVFEIVMKDEALWDELYCQIMKQLTENNINSSEERGWDLMWLATGLLSPTQLLLKELQEFLKTRPHPVAKECLQRIQKTLKKGNRKCPPYIVEIESIRQRSIHIYHKIYFPDDTEEPFEIESSTKARDLIEQISKSFEMKSSEGFSLFVKITDKVISVPEDYYIFDFIYELIDWVKSQMPSRVDQQHIQLHYQLFFLKKMWINFTPGYDPIADDVFYFYQELPKYLNGYYKITKSEAVNNGALIYRVYFGNDKTKFQHLQGLINQLVPEDLSKDQKTDDWKKQILSVYSKQIEMTESECKLEFLKFLQNQDMFGSTFFVVNQKTINHFPPTLLIAINRNGFYIMDAKKNNLKSYSYNELSFWSSGNTYFQITFGNIMGGTKLLCETTQGYKLDDLLSSYIQHFNKKQLSINVSNRNFSKDQNIKVMIK